MRRSAGLVVGFSGLLVASCVGLGDPPATNAPGAPQVAGPQGGEDATGGQLWLIPSPQSGLMMRAALFRPPGNGPFPLAVINHGTNQVTIDRVPMPMPDFPGLTAWLVARNYAVLLPQRPGHGETGGRYLEDQGPCERPRYVESGQATADSIAAAIDFMTKQPFIRPTGVLVIGNSAGAWGALALASRNPKNVAAIVNFAGGRGGRNRGQPDNNCSPERLVAAAAEFGRTARIPTLWLYAENDSYFPPDLSRRMAAAYTAAGGKAGYVLLPPVPGEGHGLINASPPAAPWIVPLERFLARNS